MFCHLNKDIKVLWTFYRKWINGGWCIRQSKVRFLYKKIHSINTFNFNFRHSIEEVLGFSGESLSKLLDKELNESTGYDDNKHKNLINICKN